MTRGLVPCRNYLDPKSGTRIQQFKRVRFTRSGVPDLDGLARISEAMHLPIPSKALQRYRLNDGFGALRSKKVLQLHSGAVAEVFEHPKLGCAYRNPLP